MMLIDRRTDAIRQQIGSFFPNESSYKNKQRFLNIQSKLLADLFLIFLFSFFLFFSIIILYKKMIGSRIPYISIDTI